MSKTKQMRFYITAFILALCSVSCTRHSQHWETLTQMDSYIEKHPDSALNILQGIDREELIQKEEQAKYAILVWYAQTKSSGEATDIGCLNLAYDYYTKRDASNERFKAYFYRGVYLMNTKEYENAMKEFGEAEDDYEYASAHNQGLLHLYKGAIYKTYYDYHAVVEELKCAADRFLEEGSLRHYLVTNIELIDNYTMLGDIDSASHYMDIAENHLGYGKISDWHNFYITKTKLILKRDGEKDATAMLDEYLSEMPDDRHANWRVIAYIYNLAGEHEKALDCIEREAELKDVSNDADYHLVLATIKKSLKDFHGSMEAYDRAMALDDSLEIVKLHSDTRFIEERHAYEVAQIKAKNNRTIIILASIIALMSACFIIWNIRRKLLQRTAEKRVYEELYNGAVAERDALTKIIDESSVNEETKAIIRRRLDLLNKVIVFYITDNQSAYNKADKELETLISDRASFMASTRITLESSHPAFFSYLRERELTDWEINYCCLYLIGLKGKEIGEYINLKRHYTYGSVIRQKLGLTENDTNLSIYLKQTMEKMQA